MKKLFLLLGLAAVVLVSGCITKSISENKVYKSTYRFGAVAGVFVKARQVPVDQIAKVNEILDHVSVVVPDAQTSYESTWVPEIDKLLSKMEAEGKIDATKRGKIRRTAVMAIQVLDFVMTKRPEWKTNAGLGHVAVEGFIDGFRKYTGTDDPIDPGEDPVFLPIEETEKQACLDIMANSFAQN